MPPTTRTASTPIARMTAWIGTAAPSGGGDDLRGVRAAVAEPTGQEGDQVSRNPETPMRRIRENRTCDLPGPGDSHCTDHPAHDWSCYDARGDVFINVRQGWTHRHPGCPDDGHVSEEH